MVEFTMDVNYSRLNSGVGRSTKKVRTRSDLPPESEDPTVDRNGQKIQGFDLPKAKWIRLPGLLERFYSSCLLKEIGQTVGSVVKLDIYTDYACRGCFARLAVCVDLRKSLVSEVRINGQLQRVEYESLPDVCFKCECYGHGANLGTGTKVQSSDEDSVMAKSIQEKFGIQRQVKEEPFGPWMLVERRDEDEIHGVINGKDDVRAFGGNEGVIFDIGNGQHDKPPDIVVNGFSNDTVNLEATMKGLVYGLEQGPNGAPMEDDVPFVEEIMDGESDGGDKVSC
ncbi:hypothetical protein Goshw_017973 [Gossypium schwendimanii]|uniref:Uncharacterized protein n=1 Tax=Gossypium schwendimanii TaxID=34291 RepID=A0A7J9MUA3_GOSSC|nr:hypothetical protein [Gossypium schwendimanii]